MLSRFLPDLQQRNLLHQHTPGLAECLAQRPMVAYWGIDPTGPSMHIGSLAALLVVRRFQQAGHIPIVLVGGATGMVGDPSGKSKERNLLGLDQIEANVQSLRRQLERFLSFEGPNAARMVNNYDWLGSMPLLDFLRDVGKHFTVSYMLAKDSVQNRLQSGISFTEFSYQLLQAYDFWVLHQRHGCRLQLGGSEQWGNMTAGLEIIRRNEGEESHALTWPLVTRADGTKFGKTADGENLYLDPSLTSPYRFYQYWLNLADHDLRQMLLTFSALDVEEIDALVAHSQADPGARVGQRHLARELTQLVHGQAAVEAAENAARILFGQASPEELLSLDAQTLADVATELPTARLPRQRLTDGLGVLEAFADSGFVASRSEARKLLENGGLRINKQKPEGPTQRLGPQDLLHGTYLLLQSGKKNYFLLEVAD